MYARGMSVRDIQAHLQEICGIEGGMGKGLLREKYILKEVL